MAWTVELRRATGDALLGAHRQRAGGGGAARRDARRLRRRRRVRVRRARQALRGASHLEVLLADLRRDHAHALAAHLAP